MRGRSRRWSAALALGASAGCFTGDGLVGQPCERDEDCSAVFGRAVACHAGVCGLYCGDGVLTLESEACDDGNDDNTDECIDCRSAVCGDGFVWAGVEECDDGNNSDADACVGCKSAVCGDKAVHLGPEECDDGNESNADGCAACQTVVCGDGRVNPATEACDDGDADASDGCDAACRMGAEWLSHGGARHTCAIRRGVARCWGANLHGQLGVGSTTIVGDEPADMPPSDAPVEDIVEVVVAAEHTCARLAGGPDNVRCWGSGADGRLGVPGLVTPAEPDVGDAPGELPPPAVVLGGEAVQLAATATHTLAVLADGSIKCWGRCSDPGTQEITVVGDDEDPVTLALPAKMKRVAVEDQRTCALATNGALWCWGEPGPVKSSEPGFIGPPVAFTLTTPGRDVVLATRTAVLDEHGVVWTWGIVSDELEPLPLAATVMRIEGAGSLLCVVLADLTPQCRYQGTQGFDEPNPFEPVELPAPVRALHVAGAHVCALLDDGRVRCWGGNDTGQLGLGHDDPLDQPLYDVRLYAAPGAPGP